MIYDDWQSDPSPSLWAHIWAITRSGNLIFKNVVVKVILLVTVTVVAIYANCRRKHGSAGYRYSCRIAHQGNFRHLDIQARTHPHG